MFLREKSSHTFWSTQFLTKNDLPVKILMFVSLSTILDKSELGKL